MLTNHNVKHVVYRKDWTLRALKDIILILRPKLDGRLSAMSPINVKRLGKHDFIAISSKTRQSKTDKTERKILPDGFHHSRITQLTRAQFTIEHLQ